MPLIRLLERQLQKHGLSEIELPQDKEEWSRFLQVVSTTYLQSDQQRQFNESLVDTSTREMEKLYKELELRKDNELLDSEKRFQRMLESVPSVIFWSNRKGVLQGFNKEFQKLFPDRELVATQTSLHSLHWSQAISVLHNAFSSPAQSSSYDVFLELPNLTKVYKFVTQKLTEIGDEVVFVGIDVTKDREHQEELDRARATSMAASKMATLGEMASGIAHEVNNPLTVISGAAHWLKRNLGEGASAEVSARIEKIQATVQRISKIISGLKTFARDGQQDPFELYDLNQIIHESIELVSHQLEVKKVQLTCEDNLEGVRVWCRPTQISQVLINMIANAGDAIANLPERWIKLTAALESEVIKIKITDSGDGVPEAIQEKIFQPFFTTKEVGVGTGLGLSISLGILKSHQGSLAIDKQCKNTCFVITLPTSDKFDTALAQKE